MLAGLMLFMAVAAPTLQNPGFEGAHPLAGWEIYSSNRAGGGAEIRADSNHYKEGRQSLLIQSEKPQGAAVGQKIQLPVGSLWRLKVWIRTEDLKAAKESNDAGGLVEVQTRGGRLALSPTRSGTTVWREEQLLFRVPSPGEVSIVLVGLGRRMGKVWYEGEINATLAPLSKSTGKVWFDDVRLEPITGQETKDVKIFNQKIGKLPIDLKQCGQFIEPLIRLIPSLTAQQVESTSFEEEPPWRPSYVRETDKPFRPWYPEGAVHLARFAFDEDNPFNGKRSQRIDLPVAGARAGISQDGFYLQKGLGYRLHLQMRSQGKVRVWASLHGSGGIVAGPFALGRAGEDWQAAEAMLRARRSINNATLTIEFEGPGTLWLDRVYLIQEDAVLGIWRPDVVKVLKELKPGVIRFGGSTLEVFEWDKCLGPWDQRVPYATMPWGGLEPNFVGVEEFIQLCRTIGAEPLVCVRWTGKTPADAAAEVEYFNGGPESRWGSQRAKYGHRDPYHVKYWQIGNEIGGPEYDASVKAFAEAMRNADPSIKVLSSFPSADTLRSGGGYLDYLCPHHYECDDLAGKEADFKFLENEIARYANGKQVRVAVTEWNTTADDMGLPRGMLQTLGNALSCSRYQNLLHRHADLSEIAIRSNLSDSFGSGILQTGPGWLYLAPTYYAQKLYTRAAGTYPLRLEAETRLAWNLQQPDMSATLSADGRTLRIYSVNATAEVLPVAFHLADFPSAIRGGTARVLKDSQQAATPEVMNSRDDPDRIVTATRPMALTGREFKFRFDPYSVTLLELHFGH